LNGNKKHTFDFDECQLKIKNGKSKMELISTLDIDIAHFRNDYLPHEIFHYSKFLRMQRYNILEIYP